MVYNVLDYPGGVVRMTSVTEEDNELMRNYPEHDTFHRKVKQVMNFVVISIYQNRTSWPVSQIFLFFVFKFQAMKGSVGLPVGVQVVAPCYEDEMCLRVMKEVEGAADFHVIDK